MNRNDLSRLEKLESSVRQLNDAVSALDHKINLVYDKINDMKSKNILGLCEEELELAERYK